MGKALDTIGGFITNTTALGAATVSPGDSFSVRSAPFGSAISLENIWAKYATAGVIRIRSPRMHDFVQGLRYAIPAATTSPVFGDEFDNLLYPQDALTVEVQSGAADSSVIVYQLYYENLPGIDAQLRTWDEVDPQIDQFLGQEVDPTGSGTIGSWGPGRAINADNDNFKVNRWYAVLGYNIDVVTAAAVAVRGSDTGNLRCAGPGLVTAGQTIDTKDWFVRNARWTGHAYIPCFNSANRGAVLTDVIANTASPTPKICFTLALLKETG